MISAIMPLYNGVNFIIESLDSILNQTYSEWEFIIVNEFGSDDGCAEIVQEYMARDARIKMIQNTVRLGLAESLNVGIAHASGKYIARVDVDDPSYPERFMKQVEFMEAHPDVFLCGTLQRSVLPDSSYVLEVPCEAEELKTALLFGCEISHCSVMFRREIWNKYGWKYDKDCLCEDYDLWTKLMFEHKFVNLPEVLVDHRWGFENISIEKGERLHQATRAVSARTVGRFGLSIEGGDEFLLSGWRNEPKEYAKMNRAYFLKKNYRFLSELVEKNRQLHLVEECALKKILWKRWNWVCKCAGLFFKAFSYEKIRHEQIPDAPVVSIVLPVYEAADTIRETVDTILQQTYSEWELLAVCENGNMDGSTEIMRYYSALDKRIRVISNEKKEGLAASLNIGMRAAKGKYIARIDADDLMNAQRLAAQVQFMDQHSTVGISQLYQHYFGPGSNNFIHRPPVSYEGLKAKLLFFCDACHSTVMFRKAVVEQFHLYYDSSYALEDFELWSRAVCVTEFVTIPEIYGEYRVGGRNISVAKSQQIQKDMCSVVARQLEQNLGVKVSESELYLLNGWSNVVVELQESLKDEALQSLQKLLVRVWEANESCHFYDRKELLKTIAAKWRWMKYDVSWHEIPEVRTIAEALELRKNREKNKLFHSLILKPLKAMQSIRLHLDAKSVEHVSNVIKDVTDAQSYKIDGMIQARMQERYKQIETQLGVLQQQNKELMQEIAQMQYLNNKVPYVQGEKIRIVFLYQIASMWPSWDSLFAACREKRMVDAKLVFLDETNVEKSQMNGAEQFLIEQGIPYTRFEEFDMEEFLPHILVIQTPYDEWHRKKEHWSEQFKKMGCRVVYIPYGVEISDTEDSHQLHFRTNVITNCWRIYTFSDVMKADYCKFSPNRRAVRALGLPRFDYYYQNQRTTLPERIERRRAGRKVVVWKVHFPKTIIENGKKVFVTPDLHEYAAFAKQIHNYKELFFVFIPHPKFFENRDKETNWLVNEISGYLSEYENAWIDSSADYRPSLASADYVIIDRSAVMVEAGALHVPVCYVSNADYYEPVTKAIKPLIDSYYQASDCKGILQFLDMCMNNSDIKKAAREKAFEKTIPFFDGKCGERVLGDMIDGIIHDEN